MPHESASQPGLGRRLHAIDPLPQSHCKQAPPLPQAFDSAYPIGSLQQSSSVATSPSAMPELAPAGTEHKLGRSLRIHTILNPSNGEEVNQRGAYHTIKRGTGTPRPPALRRSSLPMPLTPTPIAQPKHGSIGLVPSASESSSPLYSPCVASVQPSPTISCIPSSSSTPPRSSGLAPSRVSTIYQLMDFHTSKGPVQIPVETRTGSRMADEKRKRNAGASARFRARRREKEREASKRIAVLESQLRDAEEKIERYKKEPKEKEQDALAKIAILESQLRDAREEVEWYKKERKGLLITIQALPGGDCHFPREMLPLTDRLEAAGRRRLAHR